MVPLVTACLAFFMAPLILHALGNYDYGIWEIVFSIVGYMGILDFGLQPAIVRYVARYTALQKREELQKIYSSSLLCLGAVGVVLCLALWVGAILAPPFLSPPDGERGRYACFLAIIGVQILIIFTGSVFDCFLQGLQRYSLRSAVNVISSVFGAAIVAFFLLRGHGLLTIATVDVIGRLCKFVVFACWLSRPINGGYRFRRSDVSRETLTEMFRFGVKNLVYAISVRMAVASDTLVIGAFLGAAVVPFYVIPANLLGYGRSLVWQATDVLMPYFSQMDAQGDRNAIHSAYFKISRYSLGVIVPLMLGIAALGPDFIALWMGPEYATKGTRVLYLLVAAYGVMLLNPNCSRYLIGCNRHGVLARVGLASAILNVGLSVALVSVIGIEGVAAGTLLSYSLAEPYLLWVICRILDVTVWDYVKRVVLPVAPAALAQVILLWAWKTHWPVDSYLDLFLATSCSVIVFIPLFFIIAFERADRELILSWVRRTIIGAWGTS